MISVIFLLFGLGIFSAAVQSFKKHKTTINPLSPDKARKDLAAVGKKGQDMMTALAAKKRGLAKLQKDKAASDAIERAKAAIADMEGKLGPILKGKVKAGKAKPIPRKQTKKPAKTPRQKAPAEKRPPINAGLIAAARAAR